MKLAFVGVSRVPGSANRHFSPANAGHLIVRFDDMDEKEKLRQLNELLKEPGVSKGFQSREACLEWASSVAPLLKFDPTYHSTFLAHLQRLAMPLSAPSLGASLRIMIA